MKILIVGAGAVGQVYGLHLQKAGHDISFFVKEKYAAEVRNGLVMHHLSRRGGGAVTLRNVGVVTDAAAVAGTRWDQVWLALPSDALRSELANSVLRAVGDATVVCLQPDIGDGDRVRAVVPAAQVVQGLIPFISFQSPLPGRPGPEGMAYYLPPLAATMVAGEKSRADAVIRALQRGGLRARRVEDFARVTAPTTAMFQSLVATLESNGWDMRGLAGSPALAKGLAAAREAVTATAAATGASMVPFRPLFSPLAWRLLMPVVLRLFPFDIEVYMRYHFSKVGVQTRLMLESYIALGAARGIPTPALRTLRAALP